MREAKPFGLGHMINSANRIVEIKDPSRSGYVLLVDDDPTLLRTYARVLRSKGYRVLTATDVSEARTLFGECAVDVVVTDIGLPDGNGLEMVNWVRDRDRDMPVVLITGEPSVETAVIAMERGAMRYLLKPVAPEQLCEVVETGVTQTRIRRQGGMLEEIRAAQAQRELRHRFDSALEKLFMVYQPIVRWSTKSVAGHEALVRSSEPSIPHPGALFEAADKLDANLELAQGIRRITPLPFIRDPHHGDLFYNLHARDLHDETLFDPESPLGRMSSKVVLEVTERVALDEVSDALDRVARLREMGFRIAVDDLGAGYASLNSLATLEPDVVKLDMTLIRDVHQHVTKQRLIRTIVGLCREMGTEIVAEGVENAEERDCVLDLGCDLLQGYFFAKPGPAFVVPQI